MTEPTPTRRQFVAGAAGTALTLGLAGCTSEGNSDDLSGDNESTPTDDDEQQQNDDGEHDDEHEEGEHEDDGEHGEEDGHEEEGDHDEEDGQEEEGDHDDEHGHNHDEGRLEGPSPEARVLLQTEDGQQHFAPHAVWIEPGGTVTWENESGQHDAVAYHPDNDDKPRRMPADAEPWRTDLLTDEGETVSHTFETPGVYDYYCTPHEALGMVGTVIVGEPDPHDQSALEEPQSSLPDGASSELADLGEQVNEALGHTH